MYISLTARFIHRKSVFQLKFVAFHDVWWSKRRLFSKLIEAHYNARIKWTWHSSTILIKTNCSLMLPNEWLKVAFSEPVRSVIKLPVGAKFLDVFWMRVLWKFRLRLCSYNIVSLGCSNGTFCAWWAFFIHVPSLLKIN